jgi:protein gp37
VSNIEWTEQTWNPTSGCDRISPGCDNCYALTMAKRLKGMGQAKYQNDGDPRTSGPGFGLTVHPDTLDTPLRWKQAPQVFVNSMSDLFHARVPVAFIVQVWRTMQATPQHTYQILTKRPERLVRVLDGCTTPSSWTARCRTCGWAPAWSPTTTYAASTPSPKYAPPSGSCPPSRSSARSPPLDFTGIDWTIIGGESGPGARPFNPQWATDLIDDSRQAGAAPFVKQLGSVWARDTTYAGKTVAAHGDTKGGKPQYWPAHLRVREYPKTATADA